MCDRCEHCECKCNDCYEYIEPSMIYTCDTLVEYTRKEMFKNLYGDHIKKMIESHTAFARFANATKPNKDGTVTFPIVRD